MAPQLLSLAGPAAELMRIPKPIGILNVFFPFLYGLLFIRVVDNDDSHSAQHTLLVQVPLLLFSAFIARSGGCVWDDIVDMDLDKLVERTRTRPLPRGAISPKEAYWLALALCAVWIGMLRVLLPTTRAVFVYGILITAMIVAYPYMKRITSYPQVWLGISLASGVFLGGAIAGFDILEAMVDTIYNGDFGLLDGRVYGLTSLHLAYVVFSIIADIIYASQDSKDDKKAGIKGMAVSLSGQNKTVLWALSHVQVILLMLTAIFSASDVSEATGVEGSTSLYSTQTEQRSWSAVNDQGIGFSALVAKSLQERWRFWIVAVLGNAVSLSLMVERVKLGDPVNCTRWFKLGTFGVGFTIGIGLLLEYTRQVL